MDRERDPQLVNGDQRSHYRRPQAGEQKDASRRREQIPGKSDGAPRRQRDVHNAERDQRDTRAQPEE